MQQPISALNGRSVLAVMIDHNGRLLIRTDAGDYTLGCAEGSGSSKLDTASCDLHALVGRTIASADIEYPEPTMEGYHPDDRILVYLEMTDGEAVMMEWEEEGGEALELRLLPSNYSAA